MCLELKKTYIQPESNNLMIKEGHSSVQSVTYIEILLFWCLLGL